MNVIRSGSRQGNRTAETPGVHCCLWDAAGEAADVARVGSQSGGGARDADASPRLSVCRCRWSRVLHARRRVQRDISRSPAVVGVTLDIRKLMGNMVTAELSSLVVQS